MKQKKIKQKTATLAVKEYIHLVKWLYDEHLDVLREYEELYHEGRNIDFV